MKTLGRQARFSEWRSHLPAALLLLAGVLHATPEVYVATAGDHSTGASWSTAYTNIQTAIDAVGDGGTIRLKGETFTVSNQLIWIGGANVTLRGGYSLRILSPCRERGKPLAWHTTGVLDLAGNPRVMPRSGTVDMGAMEGLPLMSTLMMVR